MDNTLIVDHNAGFFSNCTIRLKLIIDFYNTNKLYPKVDSSKQWVFYKDTSDDVTTKFFKNIESPGPYVDEKIDFFSTKDDQHHDYSQLDFKNLQPFINHYFSPSIDVETKYRELMNTYDIDLDKTIAICYRGGNKHLETNLPSHDEMISKLTEIKKQYPNYKILVQSDEVDFYQKCMKLYPDIIYFKEIIKIPSNPNTSIQYHIPHSEKLNQAVLFLSICLILSKCSKLITNSGNVGMWICLFRNNPDGVYQYLNNKEYIYGVYNENYKLLDNYWIDCKNLKIIYR